MAEVIWTEPAISGLNEIAQYIAIENRAAARKLVQSVFSGVERLITFPESGRIPPELPELHYREIIIRPCRIFYRSIGEKILILFVMREERDLRRFMLSLSY